MLNGFYCPRETSLFLDQDFCIRIWAARIRLVWLDLTDERYNISNFTDNVRLMVQQQLSQVDVVKQ